MKKVLHILPMNKISGAEKMALIICKNLKQYKPVVVCGGNELKYVFSKNDIESHSLNFFSKNILNTATKLKKIINNNDIKIIHAHDNTASLIAYITKKIYGLDVKIISHIHNCYPWLKGNGINKKIDSIVRPKYDYNIACGTVVYDFYKKNSNYLNKEKSSSLSNAMDIEEINNRNISNINNKQAVYERYSIPKDKKVLGFIGRLSDQKGIIPFIIELSKQKENFQDSIFLLVGSGDKDAEVNKLIKEIGMEKMFILTGHEEDVYKFYPIIDVFFLPSKYEGLPMVLLEAMAFKKPIVSMNVGSISEVINNETGVLIEAGKYSIFVDKLKEVKDDDMLKNKYSENAYEFVDEHYNIINYVDNITEIYDKII